MSIARDLFIEALDAKHACLEGNTEAFLHHINVVLSYVKNVAEIEENKRFWNDSKNYRKNNKKNKQITITVEV